MPGTSSSWSNRRLATDRCRQTNGRSCSISSSAMRAQTGHSSRHSRCRSTFAKCVERRPGPTQGSAIFGEMTVPERPTLVGLEDKWRERWERDQTYRFDRHDSSRPIYSIDTPPPTVSGSLHVGHTFSYTHTDLVARHRRMRGYRVFYPMGWDDNG